MVTCGRAGRTGAGLECTVSVASRDGVFAICVAPPWADERANARLGSSRGGGDGIGVSDGSLSPAATTENAFRATCSARVVTLVEATLALTSVHFGLATP